MEEAEARNEEDVDGNNDDEAEQTKWTTLTMIQHPASKPVLISIAFPSS